MEIRDFNGDGRWSREAIAARYRAYCRELHQDARTDLEPRTVEQAERRWIYPVMDAVIAGIEAGDPACVALGVDFLEEDLRFPFGKRLTSNTARALRRARLNPTQIARVRRRVLHMLLAGDVPYEFRQYARLLKKVGLGEHGPELDRAPLENPYVRRWCEYLRVGRQG